MEENIASIDADPSQGEGIYSDILHLLGRHRYQPAIPLLRKLVEMSERPYMTSQLVTLPAMGEAALPALKEMLGGNQKKQQMIAAEMLVISSRLNPQAGYSDPVSGNEFVKIRNEFLNHVYEER